MKNKLNRPTYILFLLYALILSEELEADEDSEQPCFIQPLEKVAVDRGHGLELVNSHSPCHSIISRFCL
jgi:hypothetical protein